MVKRLLYDVSLMHGAALSIVHICFFLAWFPGSVKLKLISKLHLFFLYCLVSFLQAAWSRHQHSCESPSFLSALSLELSRPHVGFLKDISV